MSITLVWLMMLFFSMFGALTLLLAHENKNAMQTSPKNNNFIFIPIPAYDVLILSHKIQKWI